MRVCLQFCSLCSLLEMEGCGSDGQEQGKNQVSAGTMVSLLCDLRCECRVLPCPLMLHLVSHRHKFEDSGCSLFWTCKIHRRELSTSNTEVVASPWGSPSSGISQSDRGWFAVGVCLGFVCSLVCEPGRAQTVESWLVICMVSFLKLWPGGWVRSFPQPLRALLLRLVLVPTCPSCSCSPAQECFEVTVGFEAACLGKRFDRLIAEMVCFYFTLSCAKTGAGPRI